jgi:hypothetical protein
MPAAEAAHQACILYSPAYTDLAFFLSSSSINLYIIYHNINEKKAYCGSAPRYATAAGSFLFFYRPNNKNGVES